MTDVYEISKEKLEELLKGAYELGWQGILEFKESVAKQLAENAILSLKKKEKSTVQAYADLGRTYTITGEATPYIVGAGGSGGGGGGAYVPSDPAQPSEAFVWSGG